MEALNNKVTGDTTKLTAAQWNQVPGEEQNTITSSGQTLSGSDLTQLTKAVSHYASSSTFYSDSGTADDYILNAINSNKSPQDKVDGIEVEFVVGNTNTGSSTLTMPGFPSSPIADSATAGFLTIGETIRMRYDNGSNTFKVVGRNQVGSHLRVADYLSTKNSDIANRPFTFCDGATLSRTIFAELFGKIGTTFGIGDGSTTFNVPDLTDIPLVNVVYTNAVSWSLQAALNPTDNVTEIAIDEHFGHVYVSDTVTGLVYKSENGTGALTAFGNFTDGFPVGLAVNQSNGDVWCVGTTNNQIYRSLGGVEDFAQVGDYASDISSPNPSGIAVNSANGDVWIGNTPTSTVVVLKRGVGTYVETGNYPVASLNDLAVNSLTGDVFAVSNTVIYKSTGGIGDFVAFGTYPGSNAVYVSVDLNNGNVWVLDTPAGEDAIYLSEDGGNFASQGVSPATKTNAHSLVVDSTNSNLWLYDSTSNTGGMYLSAGSIDTSAPSWYIHHGELTI